MKNEVKEVLEDFCRECFAVNSNVDINFNAWVDMIIYITNDQPYKKGWGDALDSVDREIVTLRNNAEESYISSPPEELTGTPSLEILTNSICSVCNVTYGEMRGRTRTAKMIQARGMFSYFGLKFGFSSVEMGKYINRSHATILFHNNKFIDYLDESAPWHKRELTLLARRIKDDLRVRLKNVNK